MRPPIRSEVSARLTVLAGADEAVPAATGRWCRTRAVDMDQRAAVIVLIAADRFPGDPADVAEGWLRCHLVVAHNSSPIPPLATSSARSHRVAMVLDTARRWLIVSPKLGPTAAHHARSERRALRAQH